MLGAYKQFHHFRLVLQTYEFAVFPSKCTGARELDEDVSRMLRAMSWLTGILLSKLQLRRNGSTAPLPKLPPRRHMGAHHFVQVVLTLPRVAGNNGRLGSRLGDVVCRGGGCWHTAARDLREREEVVYIICR